jgi:hypothetical protein
LGTYCVTNKLFILNRVVSGLWRHEATVILQTKE